jgi:hypothetical protein
MIARTLYNYDNMMDMINKYVKNSQLFIIIVINIHSRCDTFRAAGYTKLVAQMNENYRLEQE